MIQVTYQKVEFVAIPAYDSLDVLEICDLGSIQELEKNTYWDMCILALIAPCLGQMKNLQTLLMKEICITLDWPWDREMECLGVTEIFSKFSNLHKLQHLYLNECYLFPE